MSGLFLIVEGGGDGKSGKVDCRRGFRLFLERANIPSLPRIVAGGGRQQAFEKYCFKLTTGVYAMLLVDSEEPVSQPHRTDPWKHLKLRDGWDKPPGATSDQCHLMVELLEAWFLADPDALKDYFGKNFKPQKLGNTTDIEIIAKSDVYERIRQATKETKKGSYDKGRDTSEILGRLDPVKVSRC